MSLHEHQPGGVRSCECPHINPPLAEKSLGGEKSRETYRAPGARGSLRLGRCDRFYCSATGLGGWAAGAVLGPFQYVRGFHSISRDSDLPAAHDNCKCLVRAGDHFVWAAVRWL